MSVNSTMDELNNFLEQYRVKKSDEKVRFTHTRQPITPHGIGKGKFDIPRSEMNTFYKHYCNVAKFGGKFLLSITENYGAYNPLRVDFDLKSPETLGLVRQYNEDILRSVVKMYQDEIRKIVHPKHFNEEILQCIVLEKQAPRIEDGKLSDGFHLHFPNFICESATIQDGYLRKKVNQKMIESGIWQKSKFNVPVDQLIDDNLATKVWMMYGSMNYKSKHSTPYLYNRIQDVDDDKDPWKNSVERAGGCEWGHVYDHELTEITMLDVFKKDMQGRGGNVKYHLPRFLSIRGYTEPTRLIDGIEQEIAKCGILRRKRKLKKIARTRPLDEILEDIKLIKEARFMDMLSIGRADDYDMWMDVGWTLFNIGQGHEECLNMWIEFSQKSDIYKPGECEELWGTMELSGKTMGSLIYAAKQDNFEMYREYIQTNVNGFIYKSTLEKIPREFDIANVAEALFGGQFLCSDPVKNTWWHFHTHRWHPMPDAQALKNKIVKEVMDAYLQRNESLAREVRENENENPDKAAKYRVQQSRILGIVSTLKTITFVEKVVRFCKMKMTDETFPKKMNENRNILCCENGVLDLEAGIFREGRPDDYCTFSTGIEYKEYVEDDDDVLEFDLFMQKVFPNPNIRNYFMDLITACLQGGNVNKRFAICTGFSNGGKSVVFNLLSKMLGDYEGKLPRHTLMRGNNVSSGQARPELAQVRGKRIVSTQEITNMDNLDIGTLKELTGNDKFFTRNMYEVGGAINPQFTLFLQCNETPNIPGNDEATWSRIRIIDFESFFVIKSMREKFPVPKTLEEQMAMKRFKANTSISSRFDDLAPVWLWRSFKRFPRYKKKGLYEPPEVNASTDDYKNRLDLYVQFKNAFIKKVPVDEIPTSKPLKVNEGFAEFNGWYKENFYSYWKKEPIDKHKFKSEMTRRLGVIRNEKKDHYGFKGEKWYGYILLRPADKLDEDELAVEEPKKLLKPNTA